VSSNPAYSEMLSELHRNVSAQLPSFLAKQRWFGGKARQIVGVEIADAIPVGREEAAAVVLVANVKYLDGGQETYSSPIILGAQPGGYSPEDAFSRPQFLAELLDIMTRKSDLAGEKGRLHGCQASFFREMVPLSEAARPKRLAGEQSNSSVIYGERVILKFFRRLEEGENPDLEIGKFLTERGRFPYVPRIAGWIEYRPQHGKPATQAILQEFVPNKGDAWRYALKILGAFYEKAAGAGPGRGLPPSEECKEFAGEPMTHLLADIALLGKRTAELHLALASESDDAAFAPEPFTMEFQSKLERSFAELTSGILPLLRALIANVPEEFRGESQRLVAREQDILRYFHNGLSAPIHATRVRIHGDYHLGQVLYTGSDFVIIDFEGEPARPLAARRIKQSPLQDVAGMLRSFHYAAFAPLLMPPVDGSVSVSVSPSKSASVSRLAQAWSRCAAGHFLGQYYETSGAAPYLPAGIAERNRILEIYLLAKAIYELGYELNNRPAWVGIPLEGISRLLASED
jgi:trehalose synthase-fused probable maltokinase